MHRQATRLGACPSGSILQTCTLSTDHQPRIAPLPRRFCGQNQLEIPLPRRLHFRPFLPLFRSGQEPQKQKCNTFAENATPSRSLSGAPPHRRKTVPSATEMMNWRPPQKLYKIREVRASPPAFASQNTHMCASHNGGELSRILTNNNTAAGPQSNRRKRRRQLSLLFTHSSPFWTLRLSSAILAFQTRCDCLGKTPQKKPKKLPKAAKS